MCSTGRVLSAKNFQRLWRVCVAIFSHVQVEPKKNQQLWRVFAANFLHVQVQPKKFQLLWRVFQKSVENLWAKFFRQSNSIQSHLRRLNYSSDCDGFFKIAVTIRPKYSKSITSHIWKIQWKADWSCLFIAICDGYFQKAVTSPTLNGHTHVWRVLPPQIYKVYLLFICGPFVDLALKPTNQIPQPDEWYLECQCAPPRLKKYHFRPGRPSANIAS